MSLIKEEYQKQMDTFCNTNNEITAQDILNKAQGTSVKEEKVVKIPKKNSRSMVWRAAIPAVICFLLLGTTTAAATGKFSDFFRNIFKDEKTAEIADSGFYSELNQVVEDENFRVQIMGVSGDMENAMVALDIYVKDPAVVEGRDQIYLEAYCMSRTVYENSLENYAPWEGYGVQDEVNKNLYHVSLRTGIWLTDGEESVLEIVKIRLSGQKMLSKRYNVSLRVDLQVDSNTFYPVEYMPIDDLKFQCGDITYSLTYVLSGYYHTEVIFTCGHKDEFVSDLVHKDTGAPLPLYEMWIDFIDQVVLVVDGTEYRVSENEKSFPCYEAVGSGYYHMHPCFPGFEFEKAATVELRYGDMVVNLKGDGNVE